MAIQAEVLNPKHVHNLRCACTVACARLTVPKPADTKTTGSGFRIRRFCDKGGSKAHVCKWQP